MTHSFQRNNSGTIIGITMYTNDGVYPAEFNNTNPNCTYAHGPEICQHALNILHGEDDVDEQLLINIYREIIHESMYQHVEHLIQQVYDETIALARYHKHITMDEAITAYTEHQMFPSFVLWDREVWMHAIRRSSDVIATYVVTQTDITEEV